jgi:hypothetical protein
MSLETYANLLSLVNLDLNRDMRIASRSSGGRVNPEVRLALTIRMFSRGIAFRLDDVVQSSFVYYLQCIEDNRKRHQTNSHARPALSAKRVTESRPVLYDFSSAAEPTSWLLGSTRRDLH